jgi:hypothetical protein
MTSQSTSRSSPSLWVGWIAFAAIMMVMLGFFNVVDGVAAIAQNQIFIGESLILDLSTWGWIHVIFGTAQVLVGFALVRGGAPVRMIAAVLVALNAVSHMAFATAYPFWSLLIISLDVVTLWALVVHGDEVGARS